MVSKVISSLQHPIVKHLVRLRLSSSYRQEQKSLLLSGKKLILETGRSLVFKRLLLPCGAPSLTQIRSEEVLFLPPPLFLTQPSLSFRSGTHWKELEMGLKSMLFVAHQSIVGLSK